MDVFKVHEQVIADYRAFTSGFVEVRDRRIKQLIDRILRRKNDRHDLDCDPTVAHQHLHQHQREAVETATSGASYVLTTGAGSGKLHVYGLDRADVEHVLDSFSVLRKYEERDQGEFRTKRFVLAEYDAMAKAFESGVAYRSPLDTPPGEGPRNPVRAQ